MARSSRASRNKKTITLDMSSYNPDGPDYDGQGGFHIPAGPYPMKCVSVTQKVSKNDNDQFEWVFQGTGGKAKGKQFYLYTVFGQGNKTQKLGKTLEALGIEFEPGELEFDPDEAVDAECIGFVEDDEYQGEKRSKLQRVVPSDAEVEEEEEEEEERPARRAKANGKGKKATVKVSEDEVKEMDEDELESLLDKHEVELDLTKHKTLTRKKNAVIEALTEKGVIA